MNSAKGTIYIICADPDAAQVCMDELAAFGGRYRTPRAASVETARRNFARMAPSAIFLDESTIDAHAGEMTLESAAAMLAEVVPVVVAAAPEKQANLAFLITSGAVDFVARTGHFLPIVAGMLDRRMRIVERVGRMIPFRQHEIPDDFGEILRHEVNNPLTGILGNTELLLTRREGLPPAAIERLQTIAELAVRLRETVRRLSNAWEESHEHVRSV